MNLLQLFEKFPDEDSARRWLEDVRWSEGRYCPHCHGERTYCVENESPMPYRCSDCRQYFSVRTKMVMERSKVPLRKWVIAIYLLSTAKKGLSSMALHRALGVTQKTAWMMGQKIREGWKAGMMPMSGEFEMDETYVGGKEENRKNSKKLRLGRGTAGKELVVGIKQRGGPVVATHLANTRKDTLTNFALENVSPGSTVYTDEHGGYVNLHRHFNHESIQHSVKEFVRGKAHTNGLESFWALLKRGHYGVYHKMSPKHLHRYVNEFVGRQNARLHDTLTQMALIVEGMEGRTLPYKVLIQ